MAFGKNPEVRAKQAGSFHLSATARQMDQAEQKQRRASSGGGGGGGGARFNDQYRPTTVGQDKIRVIAGDFVNQRGFVETVGGRKVGQIITENFQWYTYAEHFNARNNKSSVCSAGPLWMLKDEKCDCIGCDQYWSGKTRGPDGKPKTGFMSRRELNALTVLHYAKYYKVEQIDNSTGRPKFNPRTNEPYYQWVTANHNNKDLIKLAKEERDGARLHWSLGTTHFNTLVEYAKVVANDCISCGNQASIEAEAYICAHCGDVVIEKATTQLSEDDILRTIARPVRCPDPLCEGNKEPSMLQEVMRCTCCENPVRASVFDVDLQVKLAKSSDPNSKTTTLMIVGRGRPSPVDPKYQSFTEPLDLPKIFSPTPLDIQRTLFNVPLERAQEEVSRPYTQNRY